MRNTLNDDIAKLQKMMYLVWFTAPMMNSSIAAGILAILLLIIEICLLEVKRISALKQSSFSEDIRKPF